MATLYFNGAVDGDWNNLSNWWEDDQFTVAASALPTSSDSVIASATINNNSGSIPTVVDFTIGGSSYLQMVFTITGNCTLNDSSYIYSGGITGNCTFNDYSYIYYGTITGNCTFNGSSYNYYGGNITGNCTFNDSSYNDNNNGTITGNCTFNDSSYNVVLGNTINGDCTFNDSSYNNYGGNLTITGDCTFNDSSYNNGTITGDCTFNGSSYNNNTINGDCTFNDSSALAVSGNITGDATFNDNSIKRGTVTGTITWNSSYPSDGSLIYYYNNGSTDGDWATLGNWWLDSSFTVPINSAIGLPTSIDTTNIFAAVSSNSGSTPTVKNLNVGDNSYGNVSFDISINVNNSATFNNGAKFAYNGNKSLLLDAGKTVTFNSNSDCYGTIDCIDMTSLVNIVFNNCGNIGAAFEPYGQLSGNLTLNDSSMTIGTYTIGSRGVLTLNGTSAESGFLSNHSSASGTTVLYNKTVILNNDTTLGLTALVNLCNVTFNGTSDTYRSTYFTNCTLTFNDNSVYVSDGVGIGAEQGGAANNIYYFNDNSFNYGFIATTVNGITYGNSTVNINLAKGINGSSILGIV